MKTHDWSHLSPGPQDLAAYTDLYELTMAAGYFAENMRGQAVFELAVRSLPPNRSYLVCAGLEQALAYLRVARFSPDTIRYLRSQPALASAKPGFWRWLAGFRFSGDVWAMPEGSLAFAHEPLLFVRAPIMEAQIVETYLLAAIGGQSAVATKAARIVQAARGRPVMDFGARRTHGPQAGVMAARACYIAGCAATSNALAGQRLGVPIAGTQAHSWIMAFRSEEEAFRKYEEAFPGPATLLIDTYDTVEGAKTAARVCAALKAVRIDSGDIARLSRRVRKVLDAAGLAQTRIIASGDLNEWRIADLLRQGAPIDAFGVGTEMVLSRDEPSLGLVYKLAEIEENGSWRAVAKSSPGKATLPGLKQVWRQQGRGGRFTRDRLGLAAESLPGEAMLAQVMRGGAIARPLPTLGDIRQRLTEQLSRLPQPLRDPDSRAAYEVRLSRALRRLADTAHPLAATSC